MVANQQIQHSLCSRNVIPTIDLPLVHRIEGARHLCRVLGALDPVLWYLHFQLEGEGMSDTTIFVLGLLATIAALGPLAIAAISELRAKDHQDQGHFDS
jgi:hypothetical protein